MMKDLNNFKFHINPIFINIAIYLTKNSETVVCVLKKIKDVNCKIINNLDNIENFDLLITDKNLTTSFNTLKIFFVDENHFGKSLVSAKNFVEQLKVEIFEKELFKYLNPIQKSNVSEKIKLSAEINLIDILVENTFSKKYLKRKIEILQRLSELEPQNVYNKVLLANIYMNHTEQKQLANNIWQEILPRVKNKYHLLDYAELQFYLNNLDEFFKYVKIFCETKDEKYTKTFGKPLWNGEKTHKDKTLAIFFDKGFGDTIFFLRNLKQIQEQFKDVICFVHPPLANLIKDNFENIKIQNFTEITNNINFDFFISSLSIINIAKESTFRNNKQYLKANSDKVLEFSKYFDKQNFNIGIFWDSQKVREWQRNVDLAIFAPIGKIKNVQLYSLDIEKEDAELDIFDDKTKIINLGKYFKDFSDTAAAIENCDLIIATDSSVLNLAGALGKKTFGIFNQFPEWRWFQLNGDNVGWYKSVKPFQAKVQNNFEPIINQICSEITTMQNPQ